MKKLKISKLSPTPLVIILAVFVLVCTSLRVLQLSTIVDAATGFWITRNATVWILYILCIVFFLISLIFSYFSGIMTTPNFKKESNIGFFVGSIIFALSLVYEAITSLINILNHLTSSLSSSSASIYSALVSTGGFALIIETIFSFISIIFVIFVTLSAIRGNDSYKKHTVLALSPVLWAMGRLMYYFIEPVSFRNVSELFFRIILLCFACIFFMSFARITAGINEEISMKALWFAGTNTSLYAFICGFGQLFAIIGGHASLSSAYALNFADIGLALFTFTLLLTVTPLDNEVETND